MPFSESAVNDSKVLGSIDFVLFALLLPWKNVLHDALLKSECSALQYFVNKLIEMCNVRGHAV